MSLNLPRRRFLARAIAGAAMLPTAMRRVAADERRGVSVAASDLPVIDCHIHLYDPTRPQGIPWPGRDNKALYQPTLPSRFRPLAEPLGVVGAIEVECSPWLEDNQWVLDVADKDPIMVGTVGNLEPGQPDFRRQLERFAANPLFRGIRYGNIWRRDLRAASEQPAFLGDLKAVADADLVLDTANPNVELLEAVVRVSDRVPTLRIVIDHLPQMVPPTEAAARASYTASMNALRHRPQVFVKVSEVLRREGGTIPTDLEFYRARLDELMDVFGIDRVLYASDWPNSDQWLPMNAEFKLVKAYFTGQGRAAAEKYFWRNSVACYKWVRRTAAQRALE